MVLGRWSYLLVRPTIFLFLFFLTKGSYTESPLGPEGEILDVSASFLIIPVFIGLMCIYSAFSRLCFPPRASVGLSDDFQAFGRLIRRGVSWLV